MTCRHHNGTQCTLGLYGGRPSPGVCERCERYDGPTRGLGDAVHAVLRITGAHAVAKRLAPNCNCAGRRASLNSMVRNPLLPEDAGKESLPKDQTKWQ